ncbi:MAG: carboxypeptidase regulatory-like domain-containing protein [Bradyrhizobium sp.]|uniref:carboxypeptidase-like regulatory domain-containing protein n=1 Tax=Bradyrhizobium sp. TaxID=376 RepID=UPI001D31C497|nr:carboxypeptidase-like regulatory domain-containing protein [Bradyrhizobium sp.]MBV9562814.1 carboxypeptidase regulatory-like domain-containing protein [Bradyrhizobium sp.]
MSARSRTSRLRWLRNRFVIVPLLLAVVIGGWNVWVATHDHGIVTGRVIDADGTPVADANVRLWVFNFTTFVEKMAVTTDTEGRFRFTGNPSHNIQISADKAGVGRSERIAVRLYFAAEDRELAEPLRLDKPS